MNLFASVLLAEVFSILLNSYLVWFTGEAADSLEEPPCIEESRGIDETNSAKKPVTALF